MNRRTLIAALLLVCSSLALYGHGGMIHVMGIVTAMTENSVTVETTDKKMVEVAFTGATTFVQGTKPGDRKEMKVGDRVVIHAMKVKDGLQAHEVRFTQAAVKPSH
jgi:hypothetical protein